MRHRLSGLRFSVLIALTAAGTLVSCNDQEAAIPSPPFEDVFQLAEVIELEDDPIDSIAEVGVFLERRSGGFVMSDRLRPRVRTYAENGELEAAFGRFGDGPWEFRRISGLAETAAGGIVVSASNSRLTYLHSDLTRDTIVTLDGHVFGRLVAFEDDVLFTGFTPENTAEPRWGPARQVGIFHRLDAGQVAWSSWTTPARDKPYWNAMGGLATATAGDSLYIMASLLYPATILNGAGDSVGTIGQPSPSFRRIPEIPAGYFAFRAGEAPDANRMQRLLESYDLVSRMDIVDGDYMVFTLARPDPTKLPPSIREIHTVVEAYNRHTGTKLFEDVPLPEGSKIVGGGRYLYVLLNPDIPPWRVGKYRLQLPE